MGWELTFWTTDSPSIHCDVTKSSMCFFDSLKKKKKAYYASTAAILHISVRTRPQKVHAPEWKWLWVCVIALNVRKWETNWPWMSDLLSPVKRPIHAHSQPPKVMNKRPFENKLQTLLLLLLPLRTYNYIVIYMYVYVYVFGREADIVQKDGTAVLYGRAWCEWLQSSPAAVPCCIQEPGPGMWGPVVPAIQPPR